MQEKCCKSAQKGLRTIKSFVKQMKGKKATAPSETKRSEEVSTLYLH